MSSSLPKPLITTIIPTYRRPKLLERAIESVLNQTYPHFQVCVYDNASGDDTASVVASLAKRDSRVKYHCHPDNIGAIANFNHGLRLVFTPYFSLLADDNKLMPSFYEDAINKLSHYSQAILFAGQTVMIDEKGQRMGSSLACWPPGLIQPPDGLLQVWENGLPTWESVLFRTEVLESVGFLDPSTNPLADLDYMLKITRKHPLYIMKKPHAMFLWHSNSWGFHRDLSQVVSIFKELAEKSFQDEELSKPIKKRIRAAVKREIKEATTNHLYRDGVVKNDPAVLDLAIQIQKKDLGFSLKLTRAILVAKAASRNNILRKWVLFFAPRYVQFKRGLSGLLIKS